MIKSLRKTYPLYIFIDLILMGFSFYIPYILRYGFPREAFTEIGLPYFKEYSFIFILWAIFIVVSFKRRSLYSTDRGLSISKEAVRVIVSISYTAVLIGSVIFFAKFKFFSRSIFTESFFLLCVSLSGWRVIKRLILRRLISMGFHNINVLIIGAGRVGKVILEEVKKSPWWGFNIVGFLDDKLEGTVNGMPVLGSLKDFDIITKKHFVDEVIVTITSYREVVSGIIKRAKRLRLGIRVVPDSFEEPLPALDIGYLGIIPLLTYKEKIRHPAEFILKRLFDFMISLILLILLFPLFLTIAILIKLDSQGSVFYVQKRTGFKGKIFSFYKFRSMVQDADKLKSELLKKNEVKDEVIFKIKNDPRITRIGKILRRYSLDELPQLINVLKGDMSLVGPRPPMPDEVKKYNHIHMDRLSIRPGITGLSQVRGRSELTFRKWVKWDLWYVNNWSFWLDLYILWRTIPAVLRGEGAY